MSEQNSRIFTKRATFRLRHSLLLLIAAITFGGHAMAQDDPIARFTKEIIANPNLPAGYLNRCGAYSSQKRFQEALLDCSQAVKVAPNLWSTYYNRGSLYLLMKDRPSALKDFSMTISLKNDVSGAFFFRGRIYQDDKRFDLAAGDFSRIIELGFGSLNVRGVSLSDIYFNRGLCYNALGNFKAAAEDMSQTIGLDPGFQNAHYYLGVAQLKQGNNQEALKAFDTFARLKPDEWIAYGSRAIVEMNMKNYDAAITDLTKAIEMSPSDPQLFRLRANAYKGSGDGKLASKDEKMAESLEKQTQAKR